MTPLAWTRELPPPLIAVGLLLAAARRFDLRIDWRVGGVALLGALCVYGADHLLGTRRPERLKPDLRFLWILLGSALLLGLFYTGDHLSGPAVTAYLLLSQLYVFPLLPGRRRLQDFPLPRFLAILAGWTLLPFLLRDFGLTPVSGLYLAATALYLGCDILWSDFADLEHDRSAGRPTLAERLTDRSLLWICRSGLAVSAGLFTLSEAYAMAAGPLLFLAGQELLPPERFGKRSDWFLLWPLIAVLLPVSG